MGAARRKRQNSANMAAYAANYVSPPKAAAPNNYSWGGYGPGVGAPAPGHAAVAQSAGAAPAGQTAPPPDPAHLANAASANRGYTVAQAFGAGDLAELDNEYGYGADTSNPYSRAKLLEENFKRSQLGTTNSYAGQGQLYSGAYSRMQGENQRQYSIADDQSRRDYRRGRSGINRGIAEAGAGYGVSVDDSAFAALLRNF